MLLSTFPVSTSRSHKDTTTSSLRPHQVLILSLWDSHPLFPNASWSAAEVCGGWRPLCTRLSRMFHRCSFGNMLYVFLRVYNIYPTIMPFVLAFVPRDSGSGSGAQCKIKWRCIRKLLLGCWCIAIAEMCVHQTQSYVLYILRNTPQSEGRSCTALPPTTQPQNGRWNDSIGCRLLARMSRYETEYQPY